MAEKTSANMSRKEMYETRTSRCSPNAWDLPDNQVELIYIATDRYVLRCVNEGRADSLREITRLDALKVRYLFCLPDSEVPPELLQPPIFDDSVAEHEFRSFMGGRAFHVGTEGSSDTRSVFLEGYLAGLRTQRGRLCICANCGTEE